MTAVVDASVAAKWVVAEDHSDLAATLLDDDALYAPGHWMAEAANAIWAKANFGVLSTEDAMAAVELLLRAPVKAVPIASLMRQAFAISAANGVTIYDSLYLALALARDIPFVTADSKLLRKVTDQRLRPLLRWVGDLPGAGISYAT